MTRTSISIRPAPLIYGLRFGLFAVLWLALTSADLSSWMLGVPAVIFATWSSYKLAPLSPSSRIHFIALFRFLPYFLVRSFLGSVDIARRAIHPQTPIAPRLINYPLRLPQDSSATMLFVGTINLFPGTICARIQDNGLIVHVAAWHDTIVQQIEQLECLIGEVFGMELISQQNCEGSHDD